MRIAWCGVGVLWLSWAEKKEADFPWSQTNNQNEWTNEWTWFLSYDHLRSCINWRRQRTNNNLLKAQKKFAYIQIAGSKFNSISLCKHFIEYIDTMTIKFCYSIVEYWFNLKNGMIEAFWLFYRRIRGIFPQVLCYSCSALLNDFLTPNRIGRQLSWSQSI